MATPSLSPAFQALQSALDPAILSVAAESDAIDGVAPAAIARPRNAAELSSVLVAANDNALAVAPRGGGSMLQLGNPIERLDLVVDLAALNRIVSHNAADLTLVVEAGITLAALRRALAEQAQFLGLDAPLPDRATIGGILASGASGPLKWHYGSPRDLVIGMQVAQPDGRLTRSGGQVVKNVSGYDMARLHVGGLGTLGVITEVSFKLTPMPRRETTLVARFDDAQSCVAAALGVFNSGVMPLAMTAYDAQVSANTGIADAAQTLAIRLGGRPRTLQRLENETHAILAKRSPSIDKLEDATTFWAQIADFGYQTDRQPHMSARIVLLPTQIPPIADALSRDEGVAIVSQPGYGMINAHWFSDAVDLADALRRARGAVHHAGGSLIVERAPLSVKAGVDIWDYSGDSLAVMRGLKAQYDPNRILNPNRFAGGI